MTAKEMCEAIIDVVRPGAPDRAELARALWTAHPSGEVWPIVELYRTVVVPSWVCPTCADYVEDTVAECPRCSAPRGGGTDR